MRRRKKRISKRMLFVALMGLAIVALWLPVRWTAPANHIMQLFAPAQQAVSNVSARVGESIDQSTANAVTGKEHRDLLLRTQALENRIVSLTQQVQSLKETNLELAALRRGGLGPDGELIPARVVRHDAASWRDAVVIDRGTGSGVSKGAAVLTATRLDGDSDGAATLASQLLVGEVVDAAPYTSDVRLTTDPGSQLTVRIGRIEGDRFVAPETVFLLQGAGDGRMIIREAKRQPDGKSSAHVGDIVVSLPGQWGLPVSLPVGRVVAVEPDDDRPLQLDSIEVHPPLDITMLTRAFVADFSPDS